MNRKRVLLAIIVLFTGSGIAPAQQTRTTEQEILQLLPQLGEARQRELERAARQLNELQLRTARTQQPQQRGGGGRVAILDRLNQTVTGYYQALASGGAWWTNTALVQRLGLTDDQKTRIERAFENHRSRLASTTELLEKEEAQLARQLETEPLDRNAILTQIDRVIQARSEVERENSAMTLEMREVLTRQQWIDLPKSDSLGRPGVRLYAPAGGGRGAAPVPAPAPQPGPGTRRGR